MRRLSTSPWRHAAAIGAAASAAAALAAAMAAAGHARGTAAARPAPALFDEVCRAAAAPLRRPAADAVTDAEKAATTNAGVAVTVPAANPAPAASVPPQAVFTLAQDDLVRVDVGSARPGAVTVHGLLAEITLAPGGRTTLVLRASRPGRFPMHFHGRDGAHFAIAAFEIAPRPQ